MKIVMTAISRRNLYQPRGQVALANVHRLYTQSPKPQQQSGESSSSSSTSSSSSSNNHSSLSSSRGRAAVTLLPSYLADARAVSQYSPSNPQGALQLGVAESQLLEDWLVPALNNKNTPQPLHADAIYYQPTAGRDDLKASFARYMEGLCHLEPGRLVPDGLVVGAGCNAVLENLCITLADPGDTVLLPTPYYAAFEFDLVARAQLKIQAVTTEAYAATPEPVADATPNRIDPTRYYPNVVSLDAAYDRAVAQGSRPRILVLSHPVNPLGVCYPSHVVQTCIDWCRKRQVHLVSDEIYAGSVHGEEFESALALATKPGTNSLGPYVHWVYSLSKDFCMSGMRVGAVYTENPEITTPLQKLNDMCQISSQTQVWTSQMMTQTLHDNESVKDVPWTTAFRQENHARLRARVAPLTQLLDQYRVPYLPPTAGLFCWMDFSHYLAGRTERDLYLELVHDFGLLFTPGESMRNERPGFFRCVFTAASDDEFVIALERLEEFLKSKA